MKGLFVIAVLLILTTSVQAVKDADIIVAIDGSGDYTSLTEAIDNLPYYNYQRLVIYVRNGVYNEKIRIERDYLTIIGESRDSTILEFNQLREDWKKNKDDIGPAVVNIHADDVILDNMTIRNTQPKIGPHAFAIYGKGTRTIITNCNVTSNGGDTVSLWNYKEGMYYHNNCYFEGAVDFVCPRGWCYISNSVFHELKNTAAIWHAAPNNENQKFVLKNCEFTGVDSFYLARHHYDAQFYFIDCIFPQEMRNKPIKQVLYPENPEKNRPYLYGDRHYFNNCKRIGGDYKWFSDNINVDNCNITPNEITPSWTFDSNWNPIDTSSLKIIKKEYKDGALYLWFDEIVMPVGNFKIKFKSGKVFSYYAGGGRKRIELRGKDLLTEKELELLEVASGNIKNIKATTQPRFLKKVR